MKEIQEQNRFEVAEEELLLEEKLTIQNDYMFNRVMRKPDICKAFLQDVLPDIKIGRLEYLETQKTVESNVDTRGIRLDVYAEDTGKVYNIELQCADRRALPRRTRYYQSHIDMDLIKKGQDYDELKDSYVIFVCTFDPFGFGQYIYTFQSRCAEVQQLTLKDGTSKIFLNTKGKKGIIYPELKAIVDYFENKKVEPSTPLILKMKAAVEEANQDKKWRREMMTLEMKMRDRFKDGEEAGRVEGRVEGRREILMYMLKMNHPIPDISKLTGISEAEILELKKKNELKS